MIHSVPKVSFPQPVFIPHHHSHLPAFGNGREAQNNLTLSYLNLLLISDTCRKTWPEGFDWHCLLYKVFNLAHELWNFAGWVFFTCFLMSMSCSLHSSSEAEMTSGSSYSSSMLVLSFVCISDLSFCPSAPPLAPASPLLLFLPPSLFNVRSSSYSCSHFSSVLAVEVVFVFRIVEKAFITHPSCHGTDLPAPPPLCCAVSGRALVMLTSWNQMPRQSGYR